MSLKVWSLRETRGSSLQNRDQAFHDRYVTEIAAIDLDAAAVPTIMTWIRERLQSQTPVGSWVKALRGACGTWLGYDAASGTPTLLRALCKSADTLPLAIELLGEIRDRPSTVEEVVRHCDFLDQTIAEEAWRRRRTAHMTAEP